MNAIQPPKKPMPLHIRIMARSSVVSLLIAMSALLLANIQPPGVITAGLKLIFLAASSIGIAALIFWVVFSGVHFAFSKREADPVESGDLW